MRFPSTQFDTTTAVIAVVISMLSITAGASIAKSMFSTLSPENVTVLRLTISAIILFFGLKAWQARLRRQEIFRVFIYGVAIAGMNLFFYLAIKTVPVAIALAVELTGPLCVAVIFSQNRSDYIWVLFAAIGIYLLIPSSSPHSELDLTGLFYALVAAFFWGVYILVGKKVGQCYGSKAPALGLIFAAFLVIPFGDSLPFSLMNTEVALLVLVIALLSSAVPLMLEMFALRKLPTNSYGVLTSGEPVVGTIVSFFILGEQLTVMQCFGIGTVVMASMGTLLSPASSRKTLKARQ